MFKAKQTRAAARGALKGKYWWCVLATIVASLFGAVTISTSSAITDRLQRGVTQVENSAQVAPLPLSVMATVILVLVTLIGIALLVLSAPVTLGYKRFNVALYQDQESPTMGMLFSRLKITGKALWFFILMFLKVFVWSLLFVIPGIIAGYRYAMAPYILAENPQMRAIDAIRKSTEMMKGNKGRLFCMQLSFIGWGILAALVPVIGQILLLPYMEAATAAFYLNLTGKIGEKTEEEAA